MAHARMRVGVSPISPGAHTARGVSPRRWRARASPYSPAQMWAGDARGRVGQSRVGGAGLRQRGGAVDRLPLEAAGVALSALEHELPETQHVAQHGRSTVAANYSTVATRM